MTKKTKTITYEVGRPSIYLNNVRMKNGQEFHAMWFTLEQCEELIVVLTNAVKEYKNYYK